LRDLLSFVTYPNRLSVSRSNFDNALCYSSICVLSRNYFSLAIKNFTIESIGIVGGDSPFGSCYLLRFSNIVNLFALLSFLYVYYCSSSELLFNSYNLSIFSNYSADLAFNIECNSSMNLSIDSFNIYFRYATISLNVLSSSFNRPRFIPHFLDTLLFLLSSTFLPNIPSNQSFNGRIYYPAAYYPCTFLCVLLHFLQSRKCSQFG